MGDREREKKLLAPAECAARTGLTVRALRIYERRGLIAPRRSPAGWRQYGRSDLIRLNTICLLKTAGLTLSQIRTALRDGGPPLLEALQAQIETWKSKKEQTERGRAVAETALRHFRADRALSVDQLCELVRSNGDDGSKSAVSDLLKQIVAMPARQRRAWVERHNVEMNPQWARRFQGAVATLVDPRLERAMNAGYSPSSPRVQRLVALHLRLMRRHRVRQGTIKWLTVDNPQDGAGAGTGWEPVRQRMRARIRSKLKRRPTDSSDLISNQWTPNPNLVGYFAEAERRSTQCRRLDQLLCAAKEIIRSGGQASSAEAAGLIRQFRQICREHELGDPLIYAQWAALARPPPLNMSEVEDDAIWRFVADAIRARRLKREPTPLRRAVLQAG